eukprot:1736379-Alexandrium_andersonii.AAC.1
MGRSPAVLGLSVSGSEKWWPVVSSTGVRANRARAAACCACHALARRDSGPGVLVDGEWHAEIGSWTRGGTGV